MTSLPAARPDVATVPFAARLAEHGDRTAVIGPETRLTYRQLAGRVDAVARRLGEQRRLVLVAGANTLEALTTYLGALAGGHPVLLVPGDSPGAVRSAVEAYDPDVVAAEPAGAAGGWELRERRPGSAHALHPDLALLLSTSGSTGSPKLVRLSAQNLQANAASIAQYLGLREDDRAPTTLPLHYCYGLSVVNSHLLVGAAVVLTELSVVDACFWDLVRTSRTTTLAGVPFTFDLLDRVGFAGMDLPHLRRVTQAGGRLDPQRVRAYAQLGQRAGWDLFVMYGQTEATARMAYLPPDLAPAHPQAIGVPVPGGSFRIDPVPGEERPGVGELVYRGPNVMLGYAEGPGDLALGRTVEELRTGDLARRTDAGLVEVVGRRSRFLKIAGLRVDLQQAEAVLARHGLRSCCTGTDGELVVAVEGGAGDADAVRRLAVAELGLPPRAVQVVPVAELPRLATGKPDQRAVQELARTRAAAAEATPAPCPGRGAEALRALYAQLLDRPDATEDDSFATLGGDSLSYVEVSVRLEEALGHLPEQWHTRSVRELAAAVPPVPRRPRRPRLPLRTLETGVALRAVAIVLVVGTHAALFAAPGGAHVLMAVAGYNFARFQLTPLSRGARLRSQARSLARIVVPTVAWVALALALTQDYTVANLLLANALVGPEHWSREWHFWFVEVLVYVLVAMAALLALPAVDRAERRWPFAVAVGAVGAGLLTRFEVVDVAVPHPMPVLWLFALGWAAARARRLWQRFAVLAVAAAAVPGFFGDPRRDGLILAGVAVLVLVPSVRCPRLLARVAGVLASASLYVYLTHWQVYPLLQGWSAALAVAGSLAVGVALWLAVSQAPAAAPRAGAALRRMAGRRVPSRGTRPSSV